MVDFLYWKDSKISDVEELFSTKRKYILDVVFTPDEYNLLVNTVLLKTKKGLTNFAKDCILMALKEKIKPKTEDEWKLYIGNEQAIT